MRVVLIALMLALGACEEQHPTRAELQQRIDELEAENGNLKSQLEEANQHAQDASDAAQEAVSDVDDGSLEDAQDAAQRAAAEADDADQASQDQ
jgi:hypothetical protein